MTSINSLPGSNYYQLNNNSSNSASNSGSGTEQANGQSSLGGALLSALNGSSSSSPLGNDAYMLDLSPQAQQYMSSNPAPNNNNIASGNDAFILNKVQQKSIADIIVKYKDSPYTQDTFNQIQNDLSAVGLGPDQLAMKDKIKSFNPTQLLIDDLNGDFDVAQNMGSPDESGKTSNYTQQIIKQWKDISTTADQEPGSVSPVSMSA